MKDILESQRTFFHSSVITLEGDGHRSAVELLKADHRVELGTDLRHMGMVLSVDGITNSETEFWRYAVNNRKIPKPAGDYIPSKESMVVWWFGAEREPPALEL